MCSYLQEENHKAAAALELMRRLEPFNPDPEHLDPHMEQLCRDYILEDLILTSLNHYHVWRSIYYVRREGEGGVEKFDQNANAVREVA